MCTDPVEQMPFGEISGVALESVGDSPAGRKDEPPRFLVDGMLGSLARWLRLMGYDAAYAGGASDAEIVRQARAQGRVVLTRDTGLARRKGLPCLFVQGDDLVGQMAQVARAFGLSLQGAFSRCPACNLPLVDVPADASASLVPVQVRRAQKHIRSCPGCKRLFWRGTHWKRMVERLSRAVLSSRQPLEPKDAF